jgi:hypothetical protein
MSRWRKAGPIVLVCTLAILNFWSGFGLAAQDDDKGFVSLFNGRDLSGWVGGTDLHAVENGKIVCPEHKGAAKHLYTQKQYSNFVFRFEFKLDPGANSGLGIRIATGSGGNELQIMDDTAEKYNPPKRVMQPYQYHGSMYGICAAKRGHLRPVGQWNSQEVTADGRRLTVVLNGATILDVNIDEALKASARNPRSWKRERGHIGFLSHSGPRVEFRNIRIKELP